MRGIPKDCANHGTRGIAGDFEVGRATKRALIEAWSVLRRTEFCRVYLRFSDSPAICLHRAVLRSPRGPAELAEVAGNILKYLILTFIF